MSRLECAVANQLAVVRDAMVDECPQNVVTVSVLPATWAFITW